MLSPQRKEADLISIEKATISDAPEILEIQRAAFWGEATIYDNYEIPPLLQTLESLQSEFNDRTFLKAVLKDKIVGSVKFMVVDNEVEVDRLIVDPEFQNQGIGTILMNRIEGLVGRNKILKLFTGNKSERNIHVYKKLGYEIYAQSQTPQGVGLLHMKKLLR